MAVESIHTSGTVAEDDSSGGGTPTTSSSGCSENNCNEQTCLLAAQHHSTLQEEDRRPDPYGVSKGKRARNKNNKNNNNASGSGSYQQYATIAADSSSGAKYSSSGLGLEQQQQQQQQLQPLLQQRRTLAVDGNINYSSNTLLVYRLQDMRSLSNINLFLAILCLFYLGINLTLMGVNYVNNRYEESHDPSEPEHKPVNNLQFHLVEFWATFGFAIVECVALTVTPKSAYTIAYRQNGRLTPTFLKFVLCVNIVATAVPAWMITFSLDTFKIISHEIEYVNELTMSFVDVVLLVSLWNNKSNNKNRNASRKSANKCKNKSDTTATTTIDDNDDSSKWQAATTTGIALLVAILQLGVYNGLGYDKATREFKGEVPAHFLEFAFESVSALIAFWFCMDNKIVADREIGTILYGIHKQDCNLCEAQTTEYYRVLENNSSNSNLMQEQTQPLVPPSATVHYQTV